MAEPGMVERVARAMRAKAEADAGIGSQYWFDIARAAIAALAEPTEAKVEALGKWLCEYESGEWEGYSHYYRQHARAALEVLAAVAELRGDG